MGQLWNVLIVASSRQAAAGGWKDFKSPADASWQIVALACFIRGVSLGSEKDLQCDNPEGLVGLAVW